MRRLPVLIAAAIAAAPALAGCSAWQAAHDYNAPTPASYIRLNWTRIETPGNFPSVVRACYRGDGYYVNMDNSSSIEVVPGDPACKP